MRILVTGGAGYIGSHTILELLSAGYDVVAMDNFSNSKPAVIDRLYAVSGVRFRFYEADLGDSLALDKIFIENKIDGVINFAGAKAVGESVEKPLKYYRNNLSGMINLLETMVRFECRQFVFSSSATVYGAGGTPPFREEDPLGALNPYGSTKLMGETILRDVSAADPEFSAAILRYFNPIGAHPSGMLGEDPAGIPNNLLPYIARVAVGRLPYLTVFGDDWPTPDGTGIRDYIHVVDLARGHVAALAYLAAHPGCVTANLGTGRGHSVLEVLHAFERACGRQIPYEVGPRRPGDNAVSYADCTRARELFGWQAQLGLEEMCADSWHFIQQNPDGIQ